MRPSTRPVCRSVGILYTKPCKLAKSHRPSARSRLPRPRLRTIKGTSSRGAPQGWRQACTLDEENPARCLRKSIHLQAPLRSEAQHFARQSDRSFTSTAFSRVNPRQISGLKQPSQKQFKDLRNSYHNRPQSASARRVGGADVPVLDVHVLDRGIPVRRPQELGIARAAIAWPPLKP